MTNPIISALLYFSLAAISILGTFLTGIILTKKTKKSKPYIIPDSKFLHILGLWLCFYVIAFLTEWLGHIIGIWHWYDPVYIFLHAAYWWANLLTVSVLFLSALNKYLRYFILLVFILLFEYLQQAYIHWVTHYPLLGNPFLTITIVMSSVCLISFKALDIVQKIKLLNKL